MRKLVLEQTIARKLRVAVLLVELTARREASQAALAQAPFELALVTDDGQPPLSAERTFTADVQETIAPPAISQIGPQSVDENTTLRLVVQARDPDNLGKPLAYSLENSPASAVIDPATGVFTWTPGELDGPRDYNVTVRVSKSGGALSSTMSFLVGDRKSVV